MQENWAGDLNFFSFFNTETAQITSMFNSATFLYSEYTA